MLQRRFPFLLAVALAATLCAPALTSAQDVQVIHAFTPTARSPMGGLAEAADGSLYGALYEGGRRGAIYRIAPGGAVSIVHRFDDRSAPYQTLIRGADGGIYAVSVTGGEDDAGAVYRLDPTTGAVRTVYQARESHGFLTTGASPASDGRLYVVAEGSSGPRTGGAAVLSIDPATGAATLLHEFGEWGNVPFHFATSPIEGPDGYLYGTAQDGGIPLKGVVYRMDRLTGETTILHQFTGPDGAHPRSLTRTSDGRLYGITAAGGAEGAGVIVRLNPMSGAVTPVLHIRPSLGHGRGPYSRLVEGIDGHLYGTSRPLVDAQPGDLSSIYRIRRLPGETYALDVIRTSSSSSGADLVQASDGFIYGVEMSIPNVLGGVVFRFNPLGGGPGGNPWNYTVRAQFGTSPSPARPAGPPIRAANGFLYGVTQVGGVDGGRGAIYRLDPATGAVTIVAPLPVNGGCIESHNSGLVRAADDRLYGTTTCNGNNTIFRFDPAAATATTLLVETNPTVMYPFGLHGLVNVPGRGLYGLRSKTNFIEVYRFDTATATATVLTQFRQDGVVSWPQPTLTVTGDGALYVMSVVLDGGSSVLSAQARLLRIDPFSFAHTVASPLGHMFATEAPVEAGDGRLLLTLGTGDSQRIGAFDRATTTWTTLCAVPSPRKLVSLTVDPDGRVFGVLRTEYDHHRQTPSLVQCDPATGTLTTRHEFSRLEGVPVGGFAWDGGLVYGSTEFGSKGGGALVRFASIGAPPSIDTDGDGLPNGWESKYGLDPTTASAGDGGSGDPDGDGHTNAEELAAGTHPRGVVTRYLAEGAAGAFFDTRIAVVNPFAEQASVVVRFLPDSGAVVPYRLVVPARTRRTIDPEMLQGLENASFSTVIEADRPIAVDRTLHWDAGRYGSHTETAVLAPATTWYLAEGSTSGDFALFYLLQNPNPFPVQTTVRYLRPSGTPIDRPMTLPASSRTTIAVDAAGPELASTDLSAVITAAAPIIVERAMYLTRPGQPFGAGHASAGVTAPALQWFLAEGATGSFFDLFVLVANPNPTAAAITVDYLVIGGGVVTKTYTVPPQSRFTIWVDDEQVPAGSGQRPLANTALSTTIRSTNDVPIIVERTMWWPGPGAAADFWYEAHNSPGATATATRWVVADGEIGGDSAASSYVLIANPSLGMGRARLVYFTEDGAGASYNVGYYDVDLPPQSRTNVALAEVFPQVPQRVGVVVESIGRNPVPIVVEHATYASPGGIMWASGTNALAVPVP
jgi:uncharacterized repeat protein (TIGR03803 family)